MAEPGTEDIFSLQNVVHLKLVALRRLQQRITVNLGIPAADIRNGILHSPIIGIVLITAQRKLQDMSGSRHIVQIDGRIQIPLVPYGRFIAFYG